MWCSILQYFEHVEEAEWAVQVLKATGKPVAATMCIGPMGDMHGVSPGECAVRLVKAGMLVGFVLSSSWGHLIMNCLLSLFEIIKIKYCG